MALNKCEAIETADNPACVAANDVFEEQFVRGAKTLPAVPECEGVTGGDRYIATCGAPESSPRRDCCALRSDRSAWRIEAAGALPGRTARRSGSGNGRGFSAARARRQDERPREQRACDVPDRNGGVCADRAQVPRGNGSGRRAQKTFHPSLVWRLDNGGRPGAGAPSDASSACRQRKHGDCRSPMPCSSETRSTSPAAAASISRR